MAEETSMFELRFLETRQRLKEQIRRKMRKENGDSDAPVETNKKDDSFDQSYGSFFGPSEPSIAPRLFQMSKNYSVEEQLSEIKKLTSGRSSAKASSGEGKAVTTAVEKSKIQTLKESRDYSSLFSEDASAADPIPQPPTLSPPATKPKSVSPESRKEQSGHKQVIRNKGSVPKPPVSAPTSVSNSKVKPLATKKNPEEPKSPVSPPASVSNSNVKPFATKKNPEESKTPVSAPASVSNSKVKPFAAKKNPEEPKSPVSPPASVLNSKVKPFTAKMNPEEPKSLKLKTKARQNVKETVSGNSSSLQGSKKRPVREEYVDDAEDQKALEIVRMMFKTDRFAGRDDSDMAMETNYREIMKEERRSAKLGRKEDIEQLRLLEEEEEKRERMMSRAQKKPKLNH